MKKYLSLFAFALFAGALTFSLSACGGDDDETPDTPSGDSNVDNGHVYIDLGLPSGLKWADRNVGADKVEAYGDYFAWGETKAKSDYSWNTYAYGSDYNKLTKYCSKSSYGLNGFTDVLTELELSDDAARANWGGSWRMPTRSDFQELIDNTTAEWIENYNETGVKGYRFTASNGNYIFLPAAGYRYETALNGVGLGCGYWSRSLYQGYPGYAYGLRFISEEVNVTTFFREDGHSVRPVRS